MAHPGIGGGAASCLYDLCRAVLRLHRGGEHEAGDNEGRAGEVVAVQAFAEEEIGEHGDEHGLQIKQHAGPAGAERLDAAVVKIIHQRTAGASHIGERQKAVRMQRRAFAGKQFPQIERQGGQRTGPEQEDDHRQKLDAELGAAQEHGVEGPAERAADNQQLAGVELEPHQRGKVATRDDHHHADQSEQGAERLPEAERLAEHEAGEHHRHDRRQRHDDAGGGGVGVIEPRVDHTLAQRQADGAYDQNFRRPRADQRDHRPVVVMHDRQQDRAGKRQPPEAERPGRHLGRHPFGRDVDAGR